MKYIKRKEMALFPVWTSLLTLFSLHMLPVFSCWEWHYLLRKELQTTAKPLSTSYVSLWSHSYLDVCREHRSIAVPTPIISGSCGKIMGFVCVNPTCNFEKLLPCPYSTRTRMRCPRYMCLVFNIWSFSFAVSYFNKILGIFPNAVTSIPSILVKIYL